MANMEIKNGKYVLEQTISNAGTQVINLTTQNKFVDKNIEVDITTPAGVLSPGATATNVSDAESILTEVSTQPSSGEYVTVTAQGTVNASTGGFIAEDTSVASAAVTKYYTVQTATFTVNGASVKTTRKGYVGNNVTVGTIPNGAQTITGGGLSAGTRSVSTSSDGVYNGTSYDTDDKIKFEAGEASGNYRLTSSGSATVNRAAVTKQVTTAGYFAADANPVTSIAADSTTVAIAPVSYYIKKSTLSSSSITPSTITQTVTISDGYSPVARTVTVAAMTGTTVTTSLGESGTGTYFTAGTSSDKDITLTPQFSNEAGFVAAHTNTNNGGVKYYKIKRTTVEGGVTTVSGSTVTRGTASWGDGWVSSGSLTPAAFNSTPTSGHTYVNISATSVAPVLVAGDFLYIDAGYTDDLKISLAKLVPDGSDVKGHAEYILSGHSAYDNDGILVAGSIPTYLGEYTVTAS